MLSEAEVFYASPTQFNDPLDCNPTISLDVDFSTVEQLFLKVVGEQRNQRAAANAIENHRYMASEVGDYRSRRTGRGYYLQRLVSDIREAVMLEFGKFGVWSLASNWDCPLMWSHYADQHRGLCIEYDMTDHIADGLRPVDYQADRHIYASTLARWKLDRDAGAMEEVVRAFFYAKARQWRYEREWRSVVDVGGCRDAPARVTAVHFGLRCDPAIIRAIVLMHRESPQPIKFYAMQSKKHSFELRRTLVNSEEIEAQGVLTSTAFEFRDVFVDESSEAIQSD